MPNPTPEVVETLEKIKENIKTRYIIIPSFFFLFLFFDLSTPVYLPKFTYGVVLFLLFTTFLSHLVLNKLKAPDYKTLNLGYFGYLFFDLILLTAAIYVMGGVVWLGALAYSFYIIYGFIVFPKNLAYGLLGWCGTLYALLAGLEYFEIIPYYHIFKVHEHLYKDTFFVIFTVLFAVVAFYWMGHYSNTFSRLLKKKIEEINKIKGRLEEERQSLEIKVGARTEELEEERESLEKKVRERTVELEKKTKEAEENARELQEKLIELEKFSELSVGRELKMAELKKEIQELKKALEEKNQK